MAGERREAHRDRLLVADVGEDGVEDGKRGLVGGRPEPALVQQRREAERLQRDGLAARVRARDDERPQVAELEVDRHRCGRVEERVPRAEKDDVVTDRDLGAPPRPREGPARDGEVDLRRRPRRARRARLAPAPTAAESSRRIRATSSRSALSASRSRFESSTTANGSTKSVWPEPELSWTMPGTLPRADARSASTGRPPRVGDEVVLQVLAQIAGSRARRWSRSVSRARPSRSSRRRRRSAGEAPSRRSEPSVLDGAFDRLREPSAGQGRSHPRCAGEAGVPRRTPRARYARRLPARPSTRSREAPRRRAFPLARRSRRAAAPPRTRPSSGSAAGRAARPPRSSAPAARRPPPGRRTGASASAVRLSRLARRGRREAIEDRRKLQQLERPRIHPGSLGRLCAPDGDAP